ncbi:D-aminoacyl-tRNA deacylase [Belliella kenyensis]|uniref:D-aminoacyl-tRNA deacylase n=1 Tax=Belliella kenyensis TaxID=1472724 RepID=A0ABV8ELN7_9BACT|nr:D-aminoacyl-tRNA deacylase [Belliella kenyensis]MCH7400507.1 D-aminoacyl-tRNA deacylase [Belliella kenyensis]MDN3604477.1 D-aminoacyl-tRNA deacylase [Belliella kenyensis]
MIAILQRVSSASVTVENQVIGNIGEGLMILLGIEHADDHSDIEWLCNKIVNMRIFPDEAHIMNKSLLEIKGEILLVSQFTLHASTKKGNRPSYIKAAKPEVAIPLYEKVIQILSTLIGKPIATGRFGADMKVSLTNDGPVTIHIDSKNKV